MRGAIGTEKAKQAQNKSLLKQIETQGKLLPSNMVVTGMKAAGCTE